MAEPEVEVFFLTIGRVTAPEIARKNIERAGTAEGQAHFTVDVNGPMPPEVAKDWLNVEWDAFNQRPENVGIAKAYNDDYRNSSAPYLVFMDDDIEYEQDWLKDLLGTYKRLMLVPGFRPGQLSIEVGVGIHGGAYLTPPLTITTPRGPVTVINAGFLFGPRMLHRSRLETVGQFCEEYGLYGSEDCDLCVRLTCAGFKNCYLTNQHGNNTSKEYADTPEVNQMKADMQKKYNGLYLKNCQKYLSGDWFIPHGV